VTIDSCSAVENVVDQGSAPGGGCYSGPRSHTDGRCDGDLDQTAPERGGSWLACDNMVARRSTILRVSAYWTNVQRVLRI